MSDIIKTFDYREGKRSGGREALRRVLCLMRDIEQENDFENYEECWKELKQEIFDPLTEDPLQDEVDQS